jgi:enoyl-CoA hydratase
MSADLVEAAFEQLAQIEQLGSIKVLLIAGEGAGFCAGSDLRELAHMTDEQRLFFERESGRLARQIAKLPFPVIAKVHGFAIGGGLTLAAACDLVIAHPESQWSLPEVPIGLFPAWGLSYLKARVGIPVARRLCFGVDRLNGRDAHSVGLVDYLVEKERIEAFAWGVAEHLSELPAHQLSETKSFFATQEHECSDAVAVRFFEDSARSNEAAVTFSIYRT